MISKNTFSCLMATAAILDIKSHPNRQQCNLWTVMMSLCENNQIESWQIQMGKNETLRFIRLHTVHNMACVMLSNSSLELKLILKTFKTNTLS